MKHKIASECKDVSSEPNQLCIKCPVKTNNNLTKNRECEGQQLQVFPNANLAGLSNFVGLDGHLKPLSLTVYSLNDATDKIKRF